MRREIPRKTSGASDPKRVVVDCGVSRVLVYRNQRSTIRCRALATMPNGGVVDVTSTSRWGVDDPAIASVSPVGEITFTGVKGGRLRVSAWNGTVSDTIVVEADLAILSNPANVSDIDLGKLRNANVAAPGVAWAYPYDRTVFPRGLPAPELMWNGGPDTNVVYIFLEAPNAKLEAVVNRSRAGKAIIPEADWQSFEASAEGPVKVSVKTLVGDSARVLATHTWTMASGSLRGTVYYWAVNQGRVVRLKPGRSAPEDFLAGVPGVPAASCTATCHAISANGATMLSGGDGLGGTFDLQGNRVLADNGGPPGGSQKRRFAFGGISADGRYITESYAPWPLGFAENTGGGLFNASDLTRVANSGLEGLRLGTPVWSADDRMLAFVDYYGNGAADANNGEIKVLDWNPNVPRASGLRSVVTRGSGSPLHFPTMSPDHAFVAYHRGGYRTDLGEPGDLYMSFTAPGTRSEVRLAAANGDSVALPGGERDRAWNFEPTFAPRAAGGFFWVVFTSRRTYGNELTGPANTVKQLWISAIDITATPGKDPSHPAFRLPAQATTLNLRGFWALDACKATSASCSDGTECCGGFCVPNAAGVSVCAAAPPACSRDGDRCERAADCCNTNARCIANTCASPPPGETFGAACMND